MMGETHDDEMRSFNRSSERAILIHTMPDDIHAKVISRALESRGNRVITWMDGDFATDSTVALHYGNSQLSVSCSNKSGSFNCDEIGVVWNRRRPSPQVPDFIPQKERPFVNGELRAATSSVDYLFNDSFWVNSPASTWRSEMKPVQLRGAQCCGLRIPTTLISNDPKEIVDFISTSEKCIYKPLRGLRIETDGLVRRSFTSEVTVDVLPSARALRAAPGIFQHLVQKKYEVRVQFFGSYYAGVIIRSHDLEDGYLDWRIGQGAIQSCDAVVLPDNIYASCRKLMRYLNIVSGAFDFIVTPGDDWIFLEVNAAGQFLFLETWCKELHIVDAFCQFLESSDDQFDYLPSADPVKFQDILDAIDES